ncbi:helix-turn-helix domain-containing protein [Paenibacillus thalictri]|uniref:AraC family transcriptional regulator n=1 Tax=Paenibacillus thalictri TaxID=2527873 RepID=A0A4Q9DHC5_9BACL|nr:helix-turn-helix domain-containing protein [Paenibacillus thalictri]TBL70417.1 AraC family transcriptional regulator [Paenibacillus thalictri]
MNKGNTSSVAVKHRETSISAPRGRTLAEMIRSGPAPSEQLKELLAARGLHTCFSYPTLALFEFNAAELATNAGIGGGHAPSDLQNMIERHAPGNCAVFMDEIGHISVLFSWDDRAAIVRLHALLQSYYSRIHSLTITAGIGNPCQRLSELHLSYTQAANALKHKFYRGLAEVIYFNHVSPYTNTANYPEDKEDELFRLIHDGQPDGIEPAVEEFYKALLQDGPLQREEVNNCTIQLLIGLELRIKASIGQTGSAVRQDMTSAIHLQTLTEVKRYAACCLKHLAELNGSNENLNRIIIKKALSCMEGEYEKATLHYVAEKVYITPAYLSTLFKLNMGVTFIEYLTDIRINKAKKLLKTTHLKNYEVAEKVGYSDPRYFSQIFKKKAGLSPSEYRDSLEWPN